MFYVYALLDPRKDNEPFYIGKGSGDRLNHHLGNTSKNTRNEFKWNVIKAIREAGLEPGTKVLFDGMAEAEAYAKEEELIKLYGRRRIDEGGILTNRCLGAEPPSALGRKRSEETKQKMREAKLGVPKSEEHKQAMSKARKGVKQGPRSAETKAKLSAWQQHTYAFTSPEGKTYKVKSAKLKEFCKSFGMSYGAMMAAQKTKGTYKGWLISRS
jgi:hypothetical protein